MQAARDAATTAAARKSVMDETDALHTALVGEFRTVDKAARYAAMAALGEKVAEIQFRFSEEARRFDHGAPLAAAAAPVAGVAVGVSATAAAATVAAATVAPSAIELEKRLIRIRQSVDGAWEGLEAAEAAHEVTLLSFLTYKKTDAMVAAAEAEAIELDTWSVETAAAAHGHLFAAASAVPMATCLEASAALAAIAAELPARDSRKRALEAKLQEIATRLAEEGRDALPSPWSPLENASASFALLVDKLSALRRCVGAAGKWQRLTQCMLSLHCSRAFFSLL